MNVQYGYGTQGFGVGGIGEAISIYHGKERRVEGFGWDRLMNGNGKGLVGGWVIGKRLGNGDKDGQFSSAHQFQKTQSPFIPYPD